jgi:hypothetical protein
LGNGFPPAAFGLAPALVDIFETISEFNAAIGTWGFGAVFVEGGGDIGFDATFAGLKGVATGFEGGLV